MCQGKIYKQLIFCKPSRGANASTIPIPMNDNHSKPPLPGMQKLLSVMRSLRGAERGCPWDKQQTHESLLPYLLEEAAEYREAILTLGPQNQDTLLELGDVLFQVVFHAQLLEEKGISHFDAIAENIAHKLIHRHPHVFDPNHPPFQTPEQVSRAWESLKAAQKAQQSLHSAPQTNTRSQRVSGVPKGLPSLQRAARTGEKAASFGFDWQSAAHVIDKIEEETRELKEALASGSKAKIEEELGDLLFACAQFARKQNIDPEIQTSRATLKFLGRFELMENLVLQEGKSWDSLSIDELETYWVKAKNTPTKQ